MELSALTGVALYGLAFGLGIRHAFDPDHLTVIDGVARRNYQARPRVAQCAGFLFTGGHGVVVLVAAFAATTLASHFRVPSWLEVAGTVISVVFLLGLAAVNLRSAWTATHDQVVTPVGLRARLWTGPASDNPVAVAAVGMLFALSFDTLSQAAALSLAGSHFGGVLPGVLAGGCFAAGMLLAGGLNGLWIFRLIRSANRRSAVASRVMTAAVGSLNLTIGLLALAKLASPTAGSWIDSHAPLIGAGVIASAALAFALAMRVGRGSARYPGALPVAQRQHAPGSARAAS